MIMGHEVEAGAERVRHHVAEVYGARVSRETVGSINARYRRAVRERGG
jgi:hypothetical protein